MDLTSSFKPKNGFCLPRPSSPSHPSARPSYVIVTVCRSNDVTPKKLSRKYAEIYMALNIVLRGISNI
ncbi:unnamed protein product [Malus baccata var. baccata]